MSIHFAGKKFEYDQGWDLGELVSFIKSNYSNNIKEVQYIMFLGDKFRFITILDINKHKHNVSLKSGVAYTHKNTNVVDIAYTNLKSVHFYGKDHLIELLDIIENHKNTLYYHLLYLNTNDDLFKTRSFQHRSYVNKKITEILKLEITEVEEVDGEVDGKMDGEVDGEVDEEVDGGEVDSEEGDSGEVDSEEGDSEEEDSEEVGDGVKEVKIEVEKEVDSKVKEDEKVDEVEDVNEVKDEKVDDEVEEDEKEVVEESKKDKIKKIKRTKRTKKDKKAKRSRRTKRTKKTKKDKTKTKSKDNKKIKIQSKNPFSNSIIGLVVDKNNNYQIK